MELRVWERGWNVFDTMGASSCWGREWVQGWGGVVEMEGERVWVRLRTLQKRQRRAAFYPPCSSIATCRAQMAALALVKYRTCFFSRLAWSMMR